MSALDSLGIYISIPFCRSKCSYCNFASGVHTLALQEKYVARLCADIRSVRKHAAEWRVKLPERLDSVYFGGGTPSILTPKQIDMVWSALRQEFEIPETAEVTVECAPGQLEDGALDAAVACGVNRISFGVQSFVDREAAVTGRLHTREIALADIQRVRSAGVARVSIDLIAGLPHQTAASWHESLDILIGTGVEHASVYMLEVDEESRLGREMLAGGSRYHAQNVPGDELITDLYEIAVVRLEKAGLNQYEISNFTQPGSESRHNERYWRRQPYWGFGADAHSMVRCHDGSALRFETAADLNEYLGAPQLIWPADGSRIPSKTEPLRSRDGSSGLLPVEDSRRLTAEQELEEAWFLGLRLREGVRWGTLTEEFGQPRVERFRPIVDELHQLGLLHDERGSISLTRRGILFSNEVFARFINIPEVEPLAV